MITSVTNQKVKRVVQLNKKSSQRKKEGVFVVEGIKMFLEAPKELLEEVYVSEGCLQEMEKELTQAAAKPPEQGSLDTDAAKTSEHEIDADAAKASEHDWMDADAAKTVTGRKGSTETLRQHAAEKLKSCGYEVVSEEVFAKMSDTQTPQGILCVLKQLQYNLRDMIQNGKTPFFLVLENLQDPGNLGTMIRTGEGAGVSGVIMSRETVDIYNPKTIRATMGSIYRVPFFYAENLHETIGQMQESGIHVYAAHLKGTKNYDAYDYGKPTAFLIGNEGNGLTDETAALADTYIRIPMEGQLESLNAAVAAAILMYEGARQRR